MPSEVGHPAFQHPKRAAHRAYHQHVDLFSHAVIYASVLAVAEDPSLWEFFTEENLLLKPDDLVEAGMESSAVWQRLRSLKGSEVGTATKLLVGLILDDDAALRSTSFSDLRRSWDGVAPPRRGGSTTKTLEDWWSSRRALQVDDEQKNPDTEPVDNAWWDRVPAPSTTESTPAMSSRRLNPVLVVLGFYVAVLAVLIAVTLLV